MSVQSEYNFGEHVSNLPVIENNEIKEHISALLNVIEKEYNEGVNNQNVKAFTALVNLRDALYNQCLNSTLALQDSINRFTGINITIASLLQQNKTTNRDKR